MTDAQRGHPVLAELFRHNLWANLTLIDLCATLPDEILETNVPGTYGGIRETLTHLVGAEERYLSALAGRARATQSHPGRNRSRSRHPARARASIRRRVRRLRRDGRGQSDLAGDLARSILKMPAALFLVQAINHATEHRTQIKTALTQAGITPPELDGWTWDDARREQTR